MTFSRHFALKMLQYGRDSVCNVDPLSVYIYTQDVQVVKTPGLSGHNARSWGRDSFKTKAG